MDLSIQLFKDRDIIWVVTSFILFVGLRIVKIKLYLIILRCSYLDVSLVRYDLFEFSVGRSAKFRDYNFVFEGVGVIKVAV